MRKYDSSYELQWEKEIDLKAVSKKVKTKVLQEECLRLYEQNPEIDFFEKHDYHKENLYERVGPVVLDVTINNGFVYVLFNWKMIMKLTQEGEVISVYHFQDLGRSPLGFWVVDDRFYLSNESKVFIFGHAE